MATDSTIADTAGLDGQRSIARRSKSRVIRPIANPWTWFKYSQIAFIILEIAMIASSVMTLVFFDMIMKGRFESDEAMMRMANLVDGISAPIGIAYFLGYAVCVVSYARFFHRSMNNVQAAGSQTATMAPGWVWGYLFIPVLNLWKPVQGVMQVWRASMQLTGMPPRVPATIGWWWATWLGTTIVGNISWRLSISAGMFEDEITDFDLYVTTYYLDIASSALGIVCCGLLLSFASQIKRAQSAIENGEVAETFK